MTTPPTPPDEPRSYRRHLPGVIATILGNLVMAGGVLAVALLADSTIVYVLAAPMFLIGAGGVIWQIVWLLRHRGERRGSS